MELKDCKTMKDVREYFNNAGGNAAHEGYVQWSDVLAVYNAAIIAQGASTERSTVTPQSATKKATQYAIHFLGSATAVEVKPSREDVRME